MARKKTVPAVELHELTAKIIAGLASDQDRARAEVLASGLAAEAELVAAEADLDRAAAHVDALKARVTAMTRGQR